jgi:hypothetical protein
MASYFTEFGENLSLLSQALFPELRDSPSEYMNGLILTESIETEALKGSNIRLLIPRSDFNSTAEQVNSLRAFPNVTMRGVDFQRFSTFYTFGDESGFMPMPFSQIIKRDAITFALRIVDGDIADKLRNHFDVLWHNATYFPAELQE